MLLTVFPPSAQPQNRNTVNPSSTQQYLYYGYSLAVDGDTLAVGAPDDKSCSSDVISSAPDASATDCNGAAATHPASEAIGSVFIYTRSGTTWTYQAYVKAPNPSPGDRFGHTVGALAVKGDTLAVHI